VSDAARCLSAQASFAARQGVTVMQQGRASGSLRGVQVAEELTHTCWQMYHQMPSGDCLPHCHRIACEGQIVISRSSCVLLDAPIRQCSVLGGGAV